MADDNPCSNNKQPQLNDIIQFEMLISDKPTRNKYDAIAYHILTLPTPDVRHIGRCVRDDPLQMNTYFPHIGVTVSEFTTFKAIL